jgi:hypothetical protein
LGRLIGEGWQKVVSFQEEMVVVPVRRWQAVRADAENWTRFYRFQRAIVATLGVYEAAAITTGRLPTISYTAWWLRDSRWGRLVLFLVWGWLTFHLFTEGPTSDIRR